MVVDVSSNLSESLSYYSLCISLMLVTTVILEIIKNIKDALIDIIFVISSNLQVKIRYTLKKNNYPITNFANVYDSIIDILCNHSKARLDNLYTLRERGSLLTLIISVITSALLTITLSPFSNHFNFFISFSINIIDLIDKSFDDKIAFANFQHEFNLVKFREIHALTFISGILIYLRFLWLFLKKILSKIFSVYKLSISDVNKYPKEFFFKTGSLAGNFFEFSIILFSSIVFFKLLLNFYYLFFFYPIIFYMIGNIVTLIFPLYITFYTFLLQKILHFYFIYKNIIIGFIILLAILITINYFDNIIDFVSWIFIDFVSWIC